ncbi:unnamed protein product [Allacma fusca]|uniref:Uncharacterized protein n=1 Tax=Allacma fusca TaxID=39272 RepID=A0A8J2JNE2_9HEXA|nr:unnamed protein product [Allacma fusca]
METRAWKLGLYIFQLFIWTSHLTFYTYTFLVEGVITYTPEKFGHLPCPLLCGLLSFITLYLNYHTFYKWPDVYLQIFNSLVHYIPERVGARTKHTRQEWLAMIIFPMYMIIPIHHIGIFFLDITAFYFLYTHVPDHLKGSLSMAVCVTIDFYLVFMWTATYVFTLICFVIITNISCDKLQRDINALKAERNEITIRQILLPTVYKESRQLEMILHGFNTAASNIVFLVKQFQLMASVMAFYFGVRIFKFSIADGLPFLIVALWDVVMFAALFERAFELPIKMDELKQAMRDAAYRCFEGEQLELMFKQISSIPAIEVKVGQFGTMEKDEALDFVSTAVLRTADLLVTF